MQKTLQGNSMVAWFKLTNDILPVVLFTYILRKLVEAVIDLVVQGNFDFALFVEDLTLRSSELSIIMDSILRLEPGQQYYFGSPEIDQVFPILGGIILLAWQINVVLKWGQYRLLGKESGLTGVFTPIIDLGMIRLFFLMSIPLTIIWFFNPLLIQHPLSYPYSLMRYFDSIENNAGILFTAIGAIMVINSPLIARISGAPGLIVHGRNRVIDSIANSFKMVTTVRGLTVIVFALTIGILALYISAPGSLLQFPIVEQVWLQWIIKGINILMTTVLWALALSGLTIIYYENKHKLDRYY